MKDINTTAISSPHFSWSRNLLPPLSYPYTRWYAMHIFLSILLNLSQPHKRNHRGRNKKLLIGLELMRKKLLLVVKFSILSSGSYEGKLCVYLVLSKSKMRINKSPKFGRINGSFWSRMIDERRNLMKW